MDHGRADISPLLVLVSPTERCCKTSVVARSYPGAANVIRNVDHKARRFSTWAPKAIATIGTLADNLEDRAVVVRLQRKPPVATVERLGRRDNADFAAVRGQAARWAAG
jgi:hypothetical protein